MISLRPETPLPRPQGWCRLLDLRGVEFDDPALRFSVERLREQRPDAPLVHVGMDALLAAAADEVLQPPAALIFHTPRSGSTLLANMLAAPPSHVVIKQSMTINVLLSELVLAAADEDESRLYRELLLLDVGNAEALLALMLSRLAGCTRATPGPDGAVCSMELTLYPGDALYFPGGFRRDAIATDQHSLHLPLSLVAFRWHDALSRALETLELDERFRGSISPHMLTEEGFPEFSEQLQEVVRLAHEQLSAGGVFQSLRQSLLEERRPLLDGYLVDRVQLEHVQPSTAVRRRPGPFSEFRDGDDGATLQFGRKTIAEPGLDLATLRLIQAAPSFQVADLPGPLGEEEKVALVKQLLRAGFLEFAERP